MLTTPLPPPGSIADVGPPGPPLAGCRRDRRPPPHLPRHRGTEVRDDDGLGVAACAPAGLLPAVQRARLLRNRRGVARTRGCLRRGVRRRGRRDRDPSTSRTRPYAPIRDRQSPGSRRSSVGPETSTASYPRPIATSAPTSAPRGATGAPLVTRSSDATSPTTPRRSSPGWPANG